MILFEETNDIPAQSKQLGWSEKVLKIPQNTYLRNLFSERDNVIPPKNITRKGSIKEIKNNKDLSLLLSVLKNQKEVSFWGIEKKTKFPVPVRNTKKIKGLFLNG